MPLVTVLDMPANNRAMANTTAAPPPSMGVSSAPALGNSSTRVPCAKKVSAASMIMAELMAQPMVMASSVS